MFIMKKNFYLFRHGETDFNRCGIIQGRKLDVGLNDIGRRQAEKLAETTEIADAEVIYSSPLKRALETTNIIAERLKIPIVIMEDLTEGDLGIVEGVCFDDVYRYWPEIMKNWCSPESMDIGFPGGETKRQILARMQRTVRVLLAAKETNIAISSHSSVLRLFLVSVGGDGRKLPNAKLVHLVWHDGIWKIL